VRCVRLTVVITVVLTWMPGILMSLVAYLVEPERVGSQSLGDLILRGTLAQVGDTIGSSLFTALYVIAPTLLYFDLRIRKAGYALQFQAERLAAVGTPSLP